jgi:hypothetical protein
LFTYACECGGDAWFCGVYDDHLVGLETETDPETDPGPDAGAGAGTGTGIYDERFFCDD